MDKISSIMMPLTNFLEVNPIPKNAEDCFRSVHEVKEVFAFLVFVIILPFIDIFRTVVAAPKNVFWMAFAACQNWILAGLSFVSFPFNMYLAFIIWAVVLVKLFIIYTEHVEEKELHLVMMEASHKSGTKESSDDRIKRVNWTDMKSIDKSKASMPNSNHDIQQNLEENQVNVGEPTGETSPSSVSSVSTMTQKKKKKKFRLGKSIKKFKRVLRFSSK